MYSIPAETNWFVSKAPLQIVGGAIRKEVRVRLLETQSAFTII